MTGVELAILTAAATTLGVETIKGFASEAGKDLWTKTKTVLRWSDEPPISELARKVAQSIAADENIARELADLLKSNSAAAGLPDVSIAAQMVQGLTIGKIVAEKSVVATRINNLHM